MQTGRLLEVLSSLSVTSFQPNQQVRLISTVIYQVLGGHKSPVSCLCFSPVQSLLASASWDRTIRLWDMMDSWQVKETLHLTSDGK